VCWFLFLKAGIYGAAPATAEGRASRRKILSRQLSWTAGAVALCKLASIVPAALYVFSVPSLPGRAWRVSHARCACGTSWHCGLLHCADRKRETYLAGRAGVSSFSGVL